MRYHPSLAIAILVGATNAAPIAEEFGKNAPPFFSFRCCFFISLNPDLGLPFLQRSIHWSRDLELLLSHFRAATSSNLATVSPFSFFLFRLSLKADLTLTCFFQNSPL